MQCAKRERERELGWGGAGGGRERERVKIGHSLILLLLLRNVSQAPKLIPPGGGSHVAWTGDHPGTSACDAARNAAVTTRFLRALA